MSSTNVHSEKRTTKQDTFTYELCGGYVAAERDMELVMPPEASKEVEEKKLLRGSDYVVIKATGYERDENGTIKEKHSSSKSTQDVGRGE